MEVFRYDGNPCDVARVTLGIAGWKLCVLDNLTVWSKTSLVAVGGCGDTFLPSAWSD
jgi:hypothetical protein